MHLFYCNPKLHLPSKGSQVEHQEVSVLTEYWHLVVEMQKSQRGKFHRKVPPAYIYCGAIHAHTHRGSPATC